jgi:hypothetical protein
MSHIGATPPTPSSRAGMGLTTGERRKRQRALAELDSIEFIYSSRSAS